jgi:hypothetical protein
VTDARQCAGIKRDGGRCAVVVAGSQEYCYQHDPAYAEQRSRAASKAAKSKAQEVGELTELKARLKELLDAVAEGRLEKGRGSVAAQIAGVLIRAVEEERRIREQDELAAQIAELRSYVAPSGGSRRWGR